MIEAADLGKKFINAKGQSKSVFENLNFKIKKQEFVAVLGPSGCGKSTLLRILSGLDQPSSGSVKWESSGHKSSFVFQDPRLFSWRTVLENVQLPFELVSRKEVEENRAVIEKTLTLVNLKSAGNLYPFELSGGMKMRTSLARALVTSPTVLFMDEPFSALDESTRNEMQEELHQIYVTNKSTVVFVTHSISEAVFLSQRIFIMNSRGQIADEIPVGLPAKRNDKVRISQEYFNLLAEVTTRFNKLAGTKHE